jgi:hypothetical protein
MPGLTLFEKIWTQHVAAKLSGDLSLLMTVLSGCFGFQE